MDTFEREYMRADREEVEVIPKMRAAFFEAEGYMAEDAIVLQWYTTERKQSETQVGGTHYQLPIQPVEYIIKNNLGYIEGNIIKYITRYKNKNGVEDLKKAQHYIKMLIEEEERTLANTH